MCRIEENIALARRASPLSSLSTAPLMAEPAGEVRECDGHSEFGSRLLPWMRSMMSVRAVRVGVVLVTLAWSQVGSRPTDGFGRRRSADLGWRSPTAGSRAASPAADSGGNSCYHRCMAKKQLGARVDEDIADLAQKRANDRGMQLGAYLSQLVLEDASGVRERAMGAAERFLNEHQDVFDAAEDAEQDTASGARAA